MDPVTRKPPNTPLRAWFVDSVTMYVVVFTYCFVEALRLKNTPPPHTFLAALCGYVPLLATIQLWLESDVSGDNLQKANM